MMRPLIKSPSRGRLLLASGLGASLLATGAFAQQDSRPAAPGADQAAQANRPDVAPERVTVVGSYIPTAEGEGPLPVSTYTSDDLRKLTGGTAPIEALRQLPSFVGDALSENSSNGQEGGQDGTGAINLRGLGIQNTLVLINGRRASRTAGLGLADINAIPIGAIERVEILKDGASATYGSDAVAGVANFILKQTFEGAEVNFLYGNTTNNDADVRQAYVISGFKTDKFDVLVNANYYNREALFKRDRFLSSLLDRRSLGGNVSGGSSNYPGRVDSNTLGLLVLNGGQASNVVPTSPADYRTYYSGVNPATGTTDQLNVNPFTPVSPADERFSYYGAFDINIVPNVVTLYGNAIISSQRFYNSLAPSPLVIGEASTSPYDPLYDPATGTSDLADARYRTYELGNRQNFYDKKFYHFIAGLKGDVPLPGDFLKSLSYDAGVVHDEEKEINSNAGGVTASKLDIDLADGAFNPFIGQAAPNAGTALITHGPGAGTLGAYNNAAALQRDTYSAESVFFDKENLVEGHINGTFFPEAPQGGVSIALGGEYREDFTSVEPDPILVAGDNFGEFNALQGYHVQQYVSSVFGEINIPIVAPAMKVPGVYNLAFTVAGRYQKFELGGTNPVTLKQSSPTFETSNPKYALRYQPIPDITVRASYSTSFRAPGLADLFQTAATDFATIADPVTGLTNQVQNGDVQSGNPDLQPEKTDAYTAGLVLSPRFIPGFTVTADYYQLNQSNVIISGSDSAQFRVNQNFFGGGPGNPNAPFAADIVRDPASGLINSVLETPLNAARVGVEGLDISAFYEIDLKTYGKINLNLGYNHLFRYNAAVSPTSGFENFTGNFSTDPLTPGSLPVNKGLFTIEYQYKGIDLVNTINYIGDYVDNPTFVNGSTLITNAAGGAIDPANPSYTKNRRVSEYVTWDAQLSYTFASPDEVKAPTPAGKDGKDFKATAKETPAPTVPAKWYQKLLGGTRLTVGCNDILDTPPPFAAGSTESSYDESLYNIRNRFYYVSIDKKF